MWPFGRKTFDLIDDRWLREKGIPTEYRDAFIRGKKDLKSEIGRNKDKLSDSESGIADSEAEIREGHLKMARLKARQEDLGSRDDAKNSQELQETIADIGVQQGILDRQIAEKARLTQVVDNTNEALKMLQMILNKNVTTPAQLVQSPIWGSGGQTADVIDNLPRPSDIDNTEYLQSEE